MSDIIAASPEFRINILALLLFSDWMSHYGTVIQPEYFPTDAERNVVEWVSSYYNSYGKEPSDVDIVQGLNDNPLLDALFDCEDLQYAADVALEFAKSQAMKLAVLAAVDDIKSGKLADVRTRVEEALSVGQDRLDLGWDLVDDIDDWLYDELRGRRYPTGWPSIDKVLGGGIVAGEYGLIMAPTGMGKTTALINIGCALAGLIGAANVLHVTLEMPKQKVLKRYATRVAGAYLERGGAANTYKSKLLKRAHANLRAHLRVADPDPTVDAIRRLIDNLGDVEALIVDYADRIKPVQSRKERRFELAEVTQELCRLGKEYDIPVWSATQAGRQALYKEVITVADIAEAIEKATIADVIIAICQTRDEEKMGHGRLFGAKVRDARAKFFIPIKLDFSRQSIVERGRLSV